MSENRAQPTAAESIYPANTQTTQEQPAAVPVAAPQEQPAPQVAEEATTAPTVLTEGEAPEADASAPPPEPFNPEGIKMPEGATLDTETFGKFSEIAKVGGISQPVAQQLMDLYHSVASAQEMRNLDAWKTTREGWVTEVKADKEVGGSNLDEVKRTVAKILDNTELTDPKFREALEITGIGDNPAAIRTLYRWAKALSEGTPVTGGAPGDQAPPTIARAIYPKLP